MGGVLTDANGRSTLDGLWACGETVVDRRARRQPARLELAARGGGLRRPCRRRHQASTCRCAGADAAGCRAERHGRRRPEAVAALRRDHGGRCRRRPRRGRAAAGACRDRRALESRDRSMRFRNMRDHGEADRRGGAGPHRKPRRPLPLRFPRARPGVAAPHLHHPRRRRRGSRPPVAARQPTAAGP